MTTLMQPGKPLPLLGCKACITQYNTMEERLRLPELLRAAGASYTADLYKDCTHLLAKVPAGDKYKYARTWGGIHVVSADWLEETVRTGERQDESKFAVLPGQPSSRSRGRGNSSKDSGAEPQHARHDPNSTTHAGGGTATSAGAASVHQPGSSMACQSPPHTMSATRRHAKHASGTTNPALVAQLPGTHIQGPFAGAAIGGEATLGASGHSACNGAGFAGGVAKGDGSMCVGAQKGKGDSEVTGGQCHKGGAGRSGEGAAPDTLYMDFVRYHPLGVTASENLELRRLVGGCGAIREASLVPRVTHVLVGSEPSSAELQAVRDHMAEWRDQVRVVRLQWMRDCCAQGQYIEPDAGSCLTAAALMPKGQSQMAPVSSLGPNGVAASASRDPWGQASSASMDPWNSDTRSCAPGFPAVPEPPLPPEQGRALQGLFFTLAAVEGTEAEQIAGRLIKSQGGMLLGSKSIRYTDISRAYAICPHGMPEHVVIDLCRRSEEFRHVPKGQRGTLLWLQECLRTLRLVPPNVYGQPAFHPMPFHLPLKSFENARVHISGYSPDMRAAIASLIEILGGEVTQEFSKSNTYLLIANASGKKYEAAVKWGIPAVNEMWIITSAYSGQPCDAWMPKARPKGETEGMMQVAFHTCRMRQLQSASNSHTTTTSGSQSIGLEQLPGTQFPGTQHPPLSTRAHAPSITSLLNGNTSFGAAAAAAAAAAPNAIGSAHATGGAAAGAAGAALENGGILASNRGAAATGARVAVGSGVGNGGDGDGLNGHTAAPPPKKRMGLLEAMEAISDGEESALPAPSAPNREVTFTGSGFQVVDSTTNNQAMPPPRPRPVGPHTIPPSANGGVLAPPPLQPLEGTLPGGDVSVGAIGHSAAVCVVPHKQQIPHTPTSPRQHPLHPGAHAHHPAGQATAATTGTAATGAAVTDAADAVAATAGAADATADGAATTGAADATADGAATTGAAGATAPDAGEGAAGAQTFGEEVGDGSSREGDGQQQQQQQLLQQQGQKEGEVPMEPAAVADGSPGSDSMDSSQPDNKDQLQIEQLLQAAPAGTLDGSCSQFDEPLLTGNGTTNGGLGSNDGQQGGPWAVKRGESSVSLVKEMSHTSSGGGGTRGTDGDAISKPARRKRGAGAMEPPHPPAHPTHKMRQRGRIVTRRETETQEDVLQVEMSQQVGYDAGQRASDRLTGSRTRSSNNARGNAAGNAGGGVMASESQAAAKISLITRLRQKG